MGTKEATLYVAVVDVPAPNVVPDANGDGGIDASDIRALGLLSTVKKTAFFVNPQQVQ